MVVISKTIIQTFIQKHPDAENAMEKWYGDTKGATWKNFSEVKRTFNAADSVGNRYVLISKGTSIVWSP